MAGASPSQEQATALLLDTFDNLPLTNAIAKQAVKVRQHTKLKLPDAIILATAQIEQRSLLTRNTRDFQENGPFIRIPYQL